MLRRGCSPGPPGWWSCLVLPAAAKARPLHAGPARQGPRDSRGCPGPTAPRGRAGSQAAVPSLGGAPPRPRRRGRSELQDELQERSEQLRAAQQRQAGSPRAAGRALQPTCWPPALAGGQGAEVHAEGQAGHRVCRRALDSFTLHKVHQLGD